MLVKCHCNTAVSQTQRVPPPNIHILEKFMSRIKNELMNIVEDLDEVLGEGYAKKNPELIGRIFQAQSIEAAANVLYDATHLLANADSPL